MSEDKLTNRTPQFSTAEYAAQSGPDRCKTCNQTIGSEYFRVNGALACSSCAERVRAQLPKDSQTAYVRGILFGVGGAILGLVLYAGFGIVTGWMIGYVSLAVGYIEGKAIMAGSRGLGGRRYQIAAVLLTYAAVSIAAVPIAISQSVKAKKAREGTNLQESQRGQSPSDQGSSADGINASRPAQTPAKPKVTRGAALAYLVLLGLASPFLELQDPLHGAIGLVILFVGLRIAWQLTAGVRTDILGPFKTRAPASAPASAG